MRNKIEGDKPRFNGQEVLVYGEVPIDSFRQQLGTKFREVNILPIDEGRIFAELKSLPGSRVELHPVQKTAGVVDLEARVFDPSLREPLFEALIAKISPTEKALRQLYKVSENALEPSSTDSGITYGVYGDSR